MNRRILEHSPFGREYPKNHLGLYGHTSAVRKKNMLLISGGYHGSLSGDVLAYTLPKALSKKRNDKVSKKAAKIPMFFRQIQFLSMYLKT